jgi:thymidylate synthase
MIKILKLKKLMKLFSEIIEKQYANSLYNVLAYGKRKENRTGIDRISVQHQYFHIENVNEEIPLLKCKKMNPKFALIELFWFFNGLTRIDWLTERGVTYWNEWADKKGTIGKSYGKQFRDQNYINDLGFLEPIDPLANIIDEICMNPDSARIILNLWNHQDLKQMTLSPCVYDYHFVPSKIPDSNDYLIDLHVTQRSADSFLGVPYDLLMSSYFLKIIGKICSKIADRNYIPNDIHYVCHDYHIYANHIEQVNQYLHNVSENKNDVINGVANLEIGNFNFLFLDDFLRQMDDENYSKFKFVKNYEDVYGLISAPVAI